MPARRTARLALASTLLLATACGTASEPGASAQSPTTASSPSGPSPTGTASAADPGAVARARAQERAREKARTRAERAAREAKAAKVAEARLRATPEVVAVSVDGLNPTALTELGPARLPNFWALLRGGASTLNARTEQELTETLPNHTGMLTGRPVHGAAGHEVDFNTDPGGVTVPGHAGHPVMSVFDDAHAHGLSTSMYATKSKFALFERSWPDALTRSVIDEDPERLVGTLVADLAARPTSFTFVHLSPPDAAGHAHGFLGPEYLRAVEQVDGFLGRIRQAVAASPELRRSASIVLTADHGGAPGARAHTDASRREDYRVPFVVDGPGVTAGADLYALNPDYRDPGTGRPSYAGPQPVRNGDLANVSARLLGLPTVPGSVLGARSPLDVR